MPRTRCRVRGLSLKNGRSKEKIKQEDTLRRVYNDEYSTFMSRQWLYFNAHYTTCERGLYLLLTVTLGLMTDCYSIIKYTRLTHACVCCVWNLHTSDVKIVFKLSALWVPVRHSSGFPISFGLLLYFFMDKLFLPEVGVSFGGHSCSIRSEDHLFEIQMESNSQGGGGKSEDSK